MQLSRNQAIKINRLLDEWLPPAVRDWRWLWIGPFKLFYGSSYEDFLDFKSGIEEWTPEDFARFYTKTAGAPPYRKTHLNDECLVAIQSEVRDADVLEVGAGNCFLAQSLVKGGNRVTVCDVHFAPQARSPELTYVEGDALKLPFEDNSFDTVISTHTLEHIPQLSQALSELRRVARRRLVIVVPRQRASRHTFDPHVHFFPYKFSVLFAFGPTTSNTSCELVGGDWLYSETR